MDWTSILTAVAIVSGIALIAGLGLAIASKIFAVPVDEKAEAIRECLPGANCGACGFSGCDGYAAALSKGETTNTALCAPGGNDVAKAIGEVTGLAAGEVKPMAAVVLCRGHNGNAATKLEYQGVKSCRMAMQIFGGPKECVYGCLGYGDCENACPSDAIHVVNGVAKVYPGNCTGCGICTRTCPNHIIALRRAIDPTIVRCSNTQKGAQTRVACSKGCIGCMKCEKVCPTGAIKVVDNLARIDYDKCVGCVACSENCPVGVIQRF